MVVMNWYRHQSIRRKLIIAFLFILLMLGGVIGTQMYVFNKDRNTYDFMLVSTLKANTLTGTLQSHFNPELERVVNGRQAYNESQHPIILKQLEEQLLSLERKERSAVTLARFESLHKTISSLHTQLDKLNEQMETRASVDNQKATYEAILLTTSLVEQDLQQLVHAKLIENAAEKERIAAQFIQNSVILMTVFAAVIGGSLTVAWLISNEIAIPIRKLNANVAQLAAGNLTVQLVHSHSRDEIGELCDSFNTMFATLRTIINSVRETNAQAAASSQHMEAGLDENKKSGKVIAAATQQVSEALDEHDQYVQLSVREFDGLVQLFHRITTQSSQINTLAVHSVHVSQEGNEQLEYFMTQFNLLKETVKKVDQEAKHLHLLAQEMDVMLQHIRKISSETHILALNASIEARRASEHGSGFAVIAARVNQLAGQTAVISTQINEKMDHVRVTVSLIQDRMQESIRQLHTGEQVATQAQLGYHSIHAANRTVQTDIETIAEEMNHGSERLSRIHMLVKEVEVRADRIKQDIGDISAMEQEQVAALEQVAASSGRLTGQIRELNDTVSLFIE
ncbi:methyl-accepting chemotaxis protein [Paenibacillus sinopodophylli]|uniref:methyl-accepting chemotaxis protein n=1 Tax=Paenibacillus sinopodophylli TaxID=1837342 RepID=UPI001486BACB|nr:methyl-accepting chemotaxis protein [Paenibacillus sinopodophylli]